MSEPSAPASAAPAVPAAPGREPVPPVVIKANWHINGTQGIVVPEALIPKDNDGKPLPAPADPILERRLDDYRKYGVAEDVLKMVVEKTPVSEKEYKLAQLRKSSLMQDKAWVEKYFNGDQEANRVLKTLCIILGSEIIKEEKQ